MLARSRALKHKPEPDTVWQKARLFGGFFVFYVRKFDKTHFLWYNICIKIKINMLFQTRGPAAALKSVAILNFIVYVLTGALLLAAVFLIIRPAFAQSESEVAAEAPDEAVAAVSLPSELPAEPPAEVSSEPAPAIPEQSAEIPAETAESASVEFDNTPEEQPVSEEARMDAVVTLEDLGADDARILPDSPFYGFKRFGRAVSEVFTFNPVKKAELKLEHANQELADAVKLIEQKPDDSGAMEAASESLEKFQNKIVDLRNTAEDLRDEQTGGNENVGRFMTDVLDQQIKQQKVFERIEGEMTDKMPPQLAERMFEKIDDARQTAAENAAGMVTDVVRDADSLASHFDAAMRNQRGSEFKDIKNLEALKRVEQFVPEFAKDAIRRAQDNAFKRFSAQMVKMPEGERAEKFGNYVEEINGDELRHLEIFDDLGNAPDLPPEIMGKMEAAKDIAARRWQNKMEQADEKSGGGEFGQRARERYLSSFNGETADVEKLRVMEEIRKRVKFDDANLNQEIEKQREKGIEKFKEQFNRPDDKALADEFGKLSKLMAEKPDPTTFQLMAALEEKVNADPKKREFMEQMKREVRVQFVEQAQKEPDKFFSRITTNNPEDLAVFSQLKEEFKNNPEQFFAPPLNGNFQPGADGSVPPMLAPNGPNEFQSTQPMRQFKPMPIGKFFDQAIQKQTEAITERLGEIKNPEEFEQFGKKLFGMRPEVLKTLEQNSQNFRGTFESKQNFIQEVELKNLRAQEQRFNDEERGRLEAETRQKMGQARTDEERDAFEREYKAGQQELIDQNFAREKQVFEKHINFDPFCDEACRGKERAQVENKLEQQFQERQMEPKPLEFENNQPKSAAEFKPMPVFEDGRRDGDWEMKKEDARGGGSFQKSEPKVTEAGRMNGGFDNQNFQPQVKMEFRRDDFENVQEGNIEQKFESKEVFSPAPVQEKIIQQPQIIEYSPKQFNEPQEVKYEAQEVKSFESVEPVQSPAPEPVFTPSPEPVFSPSPEPAPAPISSPEPQPSIF